MRAQGLRMSREEFEQALANAVGGLMVADQGADERTNEALTAIFTYGRTAEREAEARAAFSAHSSHSV